MSKRDLFVVVADLDAEHAIKTLLAERQKAMGIVLEFSPVPPPNGDLLRYNGHDCGCYGKAVDLLRTPLRTHRHALICFDRHGSGGEALSRQRIEEEVEGLLIRNGWPKGDAMAIVIDPELEAWIWANSPKVADILGWQGDLDGLRRYLEGKGLWNAGELKPSEPKRAMQMALKSKGRPGGARLFAELARNIGFRLCADPAFNKFQATLRRWFRDSAT